MAGADRMTIEEVVKDVMVREHSDLLRAAVEAELFRVRWRPFLLGLKTS